MPPKLICVATKETPSISHSLWESCFLKAEAGAAVDLWPSPRLSLSNGQETDSTLQLSSVLSVASSSHRSQGEV